MDATWFVGNLALICTVASNFAGLPLCWKCVRSKSTDNVSALPFIAGATWFVIFLFRPNSWVIFFSSEGVFEKMTMSTAKRSTSLWMQYGVYIQDSVLITVNAIAVTLQSSYTLCYYLYTTQKDVIHLQLLTFCSLLASAFSYAWYLAENDKVAATIIGFLACGGSIFACASPLESVKQVFKTRSTKSLPFTIILSSFVVTSLWFLYGLLIKDFFIQVPNFIGALLSGFQLYLFVLYS